ncbi:MAG TPA: amidinotransferase [Flavobacteriia bacterium]|nr:amidinotransferase [Flavobacteriia bacterium]
MQTDFLTKTVLMIAPASFQLNKETAVNNFYQKEDNSISLNRIQELALNEFLVLQEKLIDQGVEVISVNDTIEPQTPDALFPNNWISFHPDGKVILYPMFAENRRKERRLDVLDLIRSKGFESNQIIDYSDKEIENRFLEGTGSMVLDRKNKIAYCSLSSRSHKELFYQFCKENGFKPIAFTSFQTVNKKRVPIYHTNVMMSIGNHYAMICLDAIDAVNEKEMVIQTLYNSGKEIINLTENQIANFAGNTLQLKGKIKDLIVMSTQAKEILTKEQLKKLEKFGKIVDAPIPTIEKFGGGSVRCMLAEVF